MQYVNLGRTGMQVSRLCLGMMTYGSRTWRPWILEQDEARPFLKRAVEAGINFLDTADAYSLGGSEEVLGRLVRDLGLDRENLVIATKVYMPISEDVNDRGLSRKHILRSIDRSLQRLQMDHVDLYQIHRWDYQTPIEETMEALHDVVKAGKARYIGASSMFVWQFAKAQAVAELHGWTRFVSMQNHYNLIYREEEREMIPCCIDQGVALIPWSPMARGFFSGNHRKGDWGDTARARSDAYAQGMYYRDEDFEVADRVQQVAKKRGVSGSQVALAWLVAKPHITAPIIGASRLEHLNEAVAALEIHLEPDEIAQLEEPYRPHPILGHS
ncbi:MAG TPA: aldo/keto reductase [Anaerolineales bacterium]|nr:aldo/keto reductase [Anaerolineales bacterium]